MSTIERRLTALEINAAPVMRPMLFISRSDLNDETDAIGFEGCPLIRADGETMDVFKDRFAAWADKQPGPCVIGHVQYRGGDHE